MYLINIEIADREGMNEWEKEKATVKASCCFTSFFCRTSAKRSSQLTYHSSQVSFIPFFLRHPTQNKAPRRPLSPPPKRGRGKKEKEEKAFHLIVVELD